MADPARWMQLLRRVRVLVYLGLIAMTIYGLWRFDIVRLPDQGCSPLDGVAPGDRLLIDAAGGAPALGQAVLFRAPSGELLLGRVAEPPASAPSEVWEACRRGALWLRIDREDCPSPDSRLLGTIEQDALLGRILAGLPW